MYAVAITGASGSILGIRLAEELLEPGHEVSVVVSEDGWKTLHYEIFRNEQKPKTVKEVLSLRGFTATERLREYSEHDFFSPLASGSSRFKAVIVAPASMKTVAAVACGYSSNLITRAVDVALKERRRCVLVPRETPLSSIHLDNMLKARNAGADIVIPVPGFYNFPQTVDDVVNFTVGKILNLLDIENSLIKEWGSESH